MNEFTKLRERGKDKRDKLTATFEADYEAALVQIAKLEQELLGTETARNKRFTACMESVLPKEATFTTVDIMTGLEALDPGRVWRKHAVN